MASSFRSAPGDELSGLAAFEQEPAQVGPLFELGDQARELLEYALRQRVHLLVGQVEGDQTDLAVQLIESEMRSP